MQKQTGKMKLFNKNILNNCRGLQIVLVCLASSVNSGLAFYILVMLEVFTSPHTGGKKTGETFNLWIDRGVQQCRVTFCGFVSGTKNYLAFSVHCLFGGDC